LCGVAKIKIALIKHKRNRGGAKEGVSYLSVGARFRDDRSQEYGGDASRTASVEFVREELALPWKPGADANEERRLWWCGP
jgi:hypothetical protein